MRLRTDYYSHFKQVEVGGDCQDAGNGLQLNPAASSSAPELKAVGDDTNIDINLTPKGTGKFGYSTGTGGAVVQATSKSTGVTLSKATGAITMNGAALAAAAEVSFTVTNTVVAATDVIAVCIKSGATAGAYAVTVDAVGAGSFQISITNLSAGSLSEAIVINFVVIKGVAA